MTAYIYNPLALWLTRRRLTRGRPGVGPRNTNLVAFLQLLAFPTIFTMFISGFWHGAGYTFILWGVFHGFLLTINHAWRQFGFKWEDHALVGSRAAVGTLLTFVSVAFAMVLFRSPTVGGAIDIFHGMLGMHGIEVPAVLFDLLGPMPAWVTLGGSADQLVSALGWTGLLTAIAFLLPNSLDILSHYEPALGIKPRLDTAPPIYRAFLWRPNLPWAAAMMAVAVVAISKLGGQSEFLYWQF